MNLVQFKRHDVDGDIFINPAHVAMVEPTSSTSCAAKPTARHQPQGEEARRDAPPADHRHSPMPTDLPAQVLLERREHASTR